MLAYAGELFGPQYRSRVFMWSGVMQAMSASAHAGQCGTREDDANVSALACLTFRDVYFAVPVPVCSQAWRCGSCPCSWT